MPANEGTRSLPAQRSTIISVSEAYFSCGGGGLPWTWRFWTHIVGTRQYNPRGSHLLALPPQLPQLLDGAALGPEPALAPGM